MEQGLYIEALYAVDYTGPTQGPDFAKDLYKMLNVERFTVPSAYQPDYILKYNKGEMSRETVEEIIQNETVFDILDDYDIIYAEFIAEYQIDLIDNDINWFKFNFLLERLKLKNNSISKRIELRSFKTDSNNPPEMNLSGKRLKEKYKLGGA